MTCCIIKLKRMNPSTTSFGLLGPGSKILAFARQIAVLNLFLHGRSLFGILTYDYYNLRFPMKNSATLSWSSIQNIFHTCIITQPNFHSIISKAQKLRNYLTKVITSLTEILNQIQIVGSRWRYLPFLEFWKLRSLVSDKEVIISKLSSATRIFFISYYSSSSVL